MKNLSFLLIGIFTLLNSNAYAFQESPFKWPSAATSMQGHFTTSDPDTPTGANWDGALSQAGSRWNSAGFTFNVSSLGNEVVDPCAIGGNQAVFHPNFCGSAFGASTLAVTFTSFFAAVPPATVGTAVESNIIFNSGKSWGVYSGTSGTGFDFRRVAVHEMGHALGLDHSGVFPAIMLPNIGGTEIPQADDIAGVAAIYGLVVANTPPNITSSAARTVAENTITVYTPITVTDAEGGAMTFAITGGADSSKFTLGSASGNLVFTSAPDFEIPSDSGANNVYNVTITVTDNGGLTDSQAFSISVSDVTEGGGNTAPNITSNPSRNIAENTIAVYTPITVSDAEGGTKTFTITGGADASKFTIGSTSGNLAFISAPDFEIPSDSGANNVYNVTVTVTDNGGLTDSQAFSISVSDVTEGGGNDPAIIATLEEPSVSDTSTGIANLRGWVVGLAAISKIELFIDGQYITDIPSGASRLDVANAFPQYPNSAAAGFSMAFAYTGLSTGNHTALIRAHNVNGLTQDASTTFRVARLENEFISDPNTVTLSNASAAISGQNIIISNLKADGKTYNIDLSWRVATQQFEMTSVSLLGNVSPFFNDGSTEKELTPFITSTSPVDAPIILTLEEPAALFTSNGIANLRGWVVGLAAISKIELFIDGQYVTDVPSGGSRGDVGNAFPQYPNADKSGFSMAFAYSELTAGSHTALVRAHDINGLTQDSSALFNTARFDNAFISDLNAVTLNSATVQINNEQILISSFVADGKSYTLRLQWQTATQQFEIQEIIKQ